MRSPSKATWNAHEFSGLMNAADLTLASLPEPAKYQAPTNPSVEQNLATVAFMAKMAKNGCTIACRF
jgi:hypothetical protein